LRKLPFPLQASRAPPGLLRTVPEEQGAAVGLRPRPSVQVSLPRRIPHPFARFRMAWRLWKTGKRQDGTQSWPSDANQSIKQLLDMYLASDAAPFSGWAAPGIIFAPDVEPVLRNGVRGYQLALWFWLFAEKHGPIAARMVANPSACSLRRRNRRPVTGLMRSSTSKAASRILSRRFPPRRARSGWRTCL
jgi:hypothetical protein